MKKIKLLLPFSFLFLVSLISAQAIIWNESFNGDAPGNSDFANSNFQEVTLVNGVNLIRGTVGNSSFKGIRQDVDAYSFSLPAGASISAIDVSNITLRNGNSASQFVSYAGNPLRISDNIGVASAPTSLLFLWGGVPLTPGDYGILINENTIEGSIYELSITCSGCPIPVLVPTLSEWGFLLLFLTLITIGVLYATAPSVALANGQATKASINLRQLPFDTALYFRILPVVALSIVALWTIAMQLFGYELTSVDPWGSLVAVPLVSYLVLLLWRK